MKKIIITTGIIAITGGLATAVLMSSCGPDCEIDDQPSVIVHLVDQDAAEGTVTHVSAESVTYEYVNDNGETVTEEAECANPDDGCTDWLLGDGVPRTYSIHANVCNNRYDSSITLEFNEEGCVDTQMVDISVSTNDCPGDIQAPEPPRPSDETQDPLTWKVPIEPACTLEARFSALVSVYAEIDGRVVPIGVDRAYYVIDPSEDGRGKGKGHDKGKGEGHEKAIGEGHHKDGRDEEIDAFCFDDQCTKFGAGIEQEGTILVGAEACGQIVEATVDVAKTEDGCHVATENVVLTFDSARGTACETKRDFEATEQRAECPSGLMAPSAYLWPVKQEGDMMISVPTEELRYFVGDPNEPGEVGDPAWCARKTAGDKCALWVTGWGQTGRFTAYTKKCGIDTVVNYAVEPDENGCGAQTQYVMVSVDERGCIRPPLGPTGDAPPDTPAVGTEVTQ